MVFPNVNRIGRPKAVKSIPILLGHYRQLHYFLENPLSKAASLKQQLPSYLKLITNNSTQFRQEN